MNRSKDMQADPIRDALVRSLNERKNVEPSEDASMKVFAYAQQKSIHKKVHRSFWKQGVAAAVLLVACVAALQMMSHFNVLDNSDSDYCLRNRIQRSPLAFKRVLKDTYSQKRYARINANATKIINKNRVRTARPIYTKQFSSSRERTKRKSTFRRFIND